MREYSIVTLRLPSTPAHVPAPSLRSDSLNMEVLQAAGAPVMDEADMFLAGEMLRIHKFYAALAGCLLLIGHITCLIVGVYGWKYELAHPGDFGGFLAILCGVFGIAGLVLAVFCLFQIMTMYLAPNIYIATELKRSNVLRRPAEEKK